MTDYGGLLDVDYDPCYHQVQACDTFAGTGGGTDPGLGLQSLDELSDGAAHTFLLLTRQGFARNPLEDSEVETGAAGRSRGGFARVELPVA